ncbi:MAG: D-glycero-alpha-D-manno-heptose-1,7-bisphosphate 7-phosphatase [Rhodanobacteraceae bacterium]
MRQAARHVILDRDGVLDAELPVGGYLVDWSQWRWLPGALDSLARLHAAGWCISVATNQSAVGRGLLARTALDAIHHRMCEEAAHAGGAIDHVFTCLHAPSRACACRKRAPGLLLDALRTTRIPRDATIAVGDDVRDIEAARRAGIPVALVRTGKGAVTATRLADTDVPVFDDLAAFTSALLAGTITTGGGPAA